MNSLLIFYLFHEQFFFEYFFNDKIEDEIKRIFTKQISNKNTQVINMIKDYFKKFRLICLCFLYKDKKSLENNFYNSKIKTEMIHPFLIELLQIAFNCQINDSNIDTFIDLYKESVEVINNRILQFLP